MGQQDSAAEPILSIGRKVYDTLSKWGATKEVPKSSSHDEAIKEMNRKSNAKRVSDATASFNPKLGGTKKKTAAKKKSKAAAKR